MGSIGPQGIAGVAGVKGATGPEWTQNLSLLPTLAGIGGFLDISGSMTVTKDVLVKGALTSNTNMTSTSITLLGPNPKAASGVLTFDGTNFLVNGMRELAVSRQISELPTTASLADVIVAFNKLIKIVSSNKEGK